MAVAITCGYGGYLLPLLAAQLVIIVVVVVVVVVIIIIIIYHDFKEKNIQILTVLTLHNVAWNLER